MSFNSQLELIYSGKASCDLGTDYWVVNKEFTCTFDSFGFQTVTIPKGFLTDGASVPRLFWIFFPRWSIYGQAACVHDFLCEYLLIKERGVIKKITRKECDLLFLKLMKDGGVSRLKRNLMYAGVALYRKLSIVRDPSITVKKADLEEYLLDHHKKTGFWL